MSKPGCDRLPLRGQAAAQEPVDLDTAVEFLAEVLTAGVGDAQAQRELEHGGGAGAMDGSYGGGRVPGRAVGAEVLEQSGIEQGGGFGAVRTSRSCQGCRGRSRVAVGQRQVRAGESGR